MKSGRQLLVFILVVFLYAPLVQAQKKSVKSHPVFVDKKGVLRWVGDKKEAAFFGVNYTTPFAYSYRAHKALGVDLEEAIRRDVYHMARLGIDAFRVHVWDTEITDTLGNLLENEHLRLFDYLLAELKKRDIKVIITPIAFWGNGYPERDEKTPGFSNKYGKGKATSDEGAIKVQEDYLGQFFGHINPYTGLAYGADNNIIATEINNEPSHSGSQKTVTDYINRLARVVRATGWTKPVYYNISQSPYYAAAVAQSEIDGVSFQWYPAGLVANHENKGNFLPFVDQYTIPFDTIPAYRNKSLMVYEFDAADIMSSYMYPAMAKSFRQAGFQWATQFAYDPLALAYANTEYQTHYLNLAYTPSKAISFLIASKVFHSLPRHQELGPYPADSSFGPFRLSHKELLSEMNSSTEFYYSNTTTSVPVSADSLQHVAGVGNSVLIKYAGTGAYFLDKIEKSVWRLEVMPDAVPIRDPFEKASPKKEVTRIVNRKHQMTIALPDLDSEFVVRGLNEGNKTNIKVSDYRFDVSPGTYLLSVKSLEKKIPANYKIGKIGLSEFVAPVPFSHEVFVRHTALTEVTGGIPFAVNATIVGLDDGDKVLLQINKLGGSFRDFGRIPMKETHAYHYAAEVPSDIVTPGLLQYKIIVQKADSSFVTYPGGFSGNPLAWDYTHNEVWETFVADDDAVLEIYNPTTDRNITIYPSFKRGFRTRYTTDNQSEQLVFQLRSDKFSDKDLMAFQFYFRDKIHGRKLGDFDKIILWAKSHSDSPIKAKVVFTDEDGGSYGTTVEMNHTAEDIVIPMEHFKADSMLLLPRPYPGFLPLWFMDKTNNRRFDFTKAERIQVIIPGDENQPVDGHPVSIDIISIKAKKD